MKISEIITEQSTLTELTRPRGRRDAGTILKKAGYVYIGDGANAEVYVKPGENTVLKLFSSDDIQYQVFQKIASDHGDNPHFPRFKGKMMRVTDRYYAIRMEKLTPLPKSTAGWNSEYELETTMEDYMAARRMSTGVVHYGSDKNDELMRILENAQPGITSALDLIISNIGPTAMIDLHSGNLMMRGDVLVIIDPLV